MKLIIFAALAAGGLTVGACSNHALIEQNDATLKSPPDRTIIHKSDTGTAVISQSGASSSATITQTSPSGTTVISQ